MQDHRNGAGTSCGGWRKLAASPAKDGTRQRKHLGTTVPVATWEVHLLLSSFKSLQEEMAHMEANGGGGGGGVPPEQYHQLEDQFNELEYQYGEVVKELQNQQGNLAFQEQLEMQINEYREEIDSYKNNF